MELCENDHLQLVDPNNFVEPGMTISNTLYNPNIHLREDFNFSGLKRDLKSTQFGNLVIYSQRAVERNLRSRRGKMTAFRPVLGLYRKYSLIDFAQFQKIKQCIASNSKLPQLDFGALLCNISNISILSMYREKVPVIKGIL